MEGKDDARVRVQLEKILASAEFGPLAKNSSKFLRFVVEETLAGDGPNLKERTIGVGAFGKALDYDTQVYTIVRSEAQRVRDRLRDYYLSCGQDFDVLIGIPKGSYVPEFSLHPREQGNEKDPGPPPVVSKGNTVLGDWRIPLWAKDGIQVCWEAIRSVGVMYRSPRAKVGTIAVTITILAGIGYATYSRFLRANQKVILVLVADFAREPDPDSFTHKLFDRLKNSTSNVKAVRVELLGKYIPWRSDETHAAPLGREMAVAEAKRKNAAIIIWGYIDQHTHPAVVTANIELLNSPRSHQLKEIPYEREVPIGDLESLTIQRQMTTSVAFIATTVLGVMRYWNEQYDEAIHLFRQGLAEPMNPADKPLFAAISFNIGLAWIRSHRFDYALEAFNRTLQLAPTNTPALVNRASVLATLGKDEPAESDYRQALAGTGLSQLNRAGMYHNLGKLLVKKKQYSPALAAYQAALKLAPQLDIVWTDLGTLRKRMGHKDAALDAFRQAVALSPTLPIAFYNLGSEEYGLGKNPEAYDHLTRSIELDPNFPAAYLIRGALSTDQEQIDLAIRDFDSILERSPTKPWSVPSQPNLESWWITDYENVPNPYDVKIRAYLERSRAFLGKGDVSKATRDASEALRLMPSAIDWFRFCGLEAGELHLADVAIAQCNAAIVLKPEIAGAWLHRGKWFGLKGDLSHAESDLKRALELDASLAEAWVARGIIRMASADFQNASKYLEVALKLNPKSVSAYKTRARLLWQQGQRLTAIRDFSHAIDLSPQGTDSYIQRGSWFAKIGQYPNAIADYTRALEMDAESYIAFNNRADCYMHQGDLPAALSDANEAIRLLPSDATVHETRGAIYLRMRSWPAALADYQESLKKKPDFDQAVIGRAMVFMEMKRLTEARADFTRVLSLTQDEEVKKNAERLLRRLPIE
jgi:tetratricopeptide (TPR) repeat protein